jgi:hypothetical protein
MKALRLDKSECQLPEMRVMLWLALLANLASVCLADGTPLTGPQLTPIRSGGYWDADLGVPIIIPSSACSFIMLGDVLGNVQHARIPNAIGTVMNLTVDGFEVSWNCDTDTGLPIPFFPLLGQSTVPSGAIAVESTTSSQELTMFVFMMNVSNWSTGQPGAVDSNGLVIQGVVQIQNNSCSIPSFSPIPAWTASSDLPLSNAAPVLWSDGNVYLFTSGRYRASPVFLAQTAPGSMGSLTSYQWWNGSALVPDAAQAQSVLSQDWMTSSVGELSAAYEGTSNQLVLCFMSYNISSLLWPQFVCQTACKPEGPWSAPEILFNAASQPWWTSGDCCPYGGYLQSVLVSESNPSALDAVVVVSLWEPYRSFAINATITSTSSCH